MSNDSSDQLETEAAHRRYLAAMHAVQSGVASKMHIDPDDTTPKHLRVGVNGALVDSSALANLLITKGVISRREYVEALADMAEAEQHSYEDYLSQHYGRHITLG